MKKIIPLLVVIVIFAISGCAGEDAKTGVGVTEEKTNENGVLGSVLSNGKLEEKEAAKPPEMMPSENVLVVADFNDASRPCNIGGDFGAWDKDPADFSQSCKDTFDPTNKFGERGFGMKLDYDVESKNPAYNGFWLKLKNTDATSFKNLVFYAKGDAESGYTTLFKVELKNANGEVGRFYATDITSEWKKISIPLNQFHGINDFKDLLELVIVFEDYMVNQKEGTIYIDDIHFSG